MITNEELAQLIRDVAKQVNDGSVASIAEIVQPLRQYAQPDQHVGQGAKMDHTPEGYRMQLEWAAGQLLAMVDEEQWQGISSWLNCAEKFTVPKAES